MDRVLRHGFLLMVLALVPALGIAQTTGKVDVPKLKAKLLQAGIIEGHLVMADDDEKRCSFQYIIEVKKPLPGGAAKLGEINARWQQALAMRSTALADLQKLQAEARAVYKNAYDIQQTPIDFEIKGEKNLAVRTTLPPIDENGKLKKLTPAELAKLKGKDPRLPGYACKLKEIAKDDWVRIYLDKTKKPMGDPPVYPVNMIIVIDPPKEVDPFVIPGS